jgi:hypothetical protein
MKIPIRKDLRNILKRMMISWSDTEMIPGSKMKNLIIPNSQIKVKMTTDRQMQYRKRRNPNLQKLGKSISFSMIFPWNSQQRIP